MKKGWTLRRPGPVAFLVLLTVAGLSADVIVLAFGLPGSGLSLLVGAVVLAALWYDRWAQWVTIVLVNAFFIPATQHITTELWHLIALYVMGILATLATAEVIHRLVKNYAASLERERLAQAQLQHIVSNSPLATYSLEVRQGPPRTVHCTFVSANMQRLTGIPADVLMQDLGLWLSHIHPDDRARLMVGDLTRRPSMVEYRFTRPDGVEIWLQDVAHTHLRPEDGVVELIVQVLDVSDRKRAQLQTEENERFVAQLAGAIPDQVLVIDLPTREIVYANRDKARLALEAMSSPNMVCEGWKSRIHPDDQKDVGAAMVSLATLPDDETLKTGWRMRDAGDDWRDLQFHFRIFKRDAHGQPAQVLAVWEDMTEARHAERALAESQKLAERVAAAVPSVVYVLDVAHATDSGAMIFNNRSLAASLGYRDSLTLSTGLDRLLQQLLHPDDLPRVRSMRSEWLKLPDGDLLEAEFRLRDATGKYRWMLSRHLAFARDEHGAITQVIGLLEDITTRKELQDEVQAERDFARLVLNTLGQGVAVLSPKNICEYLNPAGAEILGLPSADGILGVDLESLGQGSIAPDLLALKESFSSHPRTLQFDTEIKRADGRPLDLALVVTPRVQNGVFVGSVAVFTDVTERKAMERDLADALTRAQELTRDAQAATRAKSQFLANMSHEIRTPMNAIIGLAELMQDAELPAEQHNRVQVMIESGHALLDIINDILDFSKIEAGRLDLDPHDFDVAATIENTVDVLVTRASAKGLQLLTYVDPAIPARLHGDAGRLRQILLNLLSNAVKFTTHGRIVVRAELESTTPDGASVRVSVQDTGIGIPLDAQPRLFQPFEQAEHSTTRRFGGTGLGLAIVKRLVELLAGQVQLVSRPGVGTTVTLSLPFELASGGGWHASPERLRGRVLVVDPEPVSNDIATRYVSALGLAPESLFDPVTALARLGHGPQVDALIVGHWAAHAGMAHFCERLVGDPALGRLPCVMLHEGMNAVDDTRLRVVQRPFKRHELEAALSQVLRSGEGVEPRTVTVKVKDARAPIPADPLQTMQICETNASRRVLLAEDNAINQKVAMLQLEQLGYEVDVAGDGAAAQAAYQTHPDRYALILMDCQMPVLDGFAATRAIREWEAGQPGGRHVHVIAMTANAMSGDREECLAAGMDDYLAKPVSRQALQSVLQRSEAR